MCSALFRTRCMYFQFSMTTINMLLNALVYGTYLLYLRFVYFHNIFHLTDVNLLFHVHRFISQTEEVLTAFINTNLTIMLFFFIFGPSWSLFPGIIFIHNRSFSLFILLLVARNSYADALQLIFIHWSNSRLNCFVDASNCFVGEFCSVDVRFNSFGTYPDVLPYFNYIRNMFD